MLGKKSAGRGDLWIASPAFSIANPSLCYFPACSVEVFPGISEAPNFSHALCRALAHNTEL